MDNCNVLKINDFGNFVEEKWKLMKKEELDKIFLPYDCIYDIPDSDSFWNLVLKLKEMGYIPYCNMKASDYRIWSHIYRKPHGYTYDLAACNAKSTKTMKFTYIEFLGILEQKDEDWREKLSKQFNEKICNQNTTNYGTG